MAELLVDAGVRFAKQGSSSALAIAKICLGAAVAADHNHLDAKLALAEVLLTIDHDDDGALQQLQQVISAYDEDECESAARSLVALQAINLLCSAQRRRRRLAAFMHATEKGLAIAFKHNHKDWVIPLCTNCIDELCRLSDLASAMQYASSAISQCQSKEWPDHVAFFRLLYAQLAIRAADPIAREQVGKMCAVVDALEHQQPFFRVWAAALQMSQGFADGELSDFDALMTELSTPFSSELSLDACSVDITWSSAHALQGFRALFKSRLLQHQGDTSEALTVLLDGIGSLESVVTHSEWPLRIALQHQIVLVQLDLGQFKDAAEWLQIVIRQRESVPAGHQRSASALLYCSVAQYCLCLRRAPAWHNGFAAVQCIVRDKENSLYHFALLQQTLASPSCDPDEVGRVALPLSSSVCSPVSQAAHIAAGLAFLSIGQNSKAENCLRSAALASEGFLGQKALRCIALALLGSALSRQGQAAEARNVLNIATTEVLQTKSICSICAVLSLVLTLLVEMKTQSPLIARVQTELIAAKRELVARLSTAKQSDAHEEVLQFASTAFDFAIRRQRSLGAPRLTPNKATTPSKDKMLNRATTPSQTTTPNRTPTPRKAKMPIRATTPRKAKVANGATTPSKATTSNGATTPSLANTPNRATPPRKAKTSSRATTPRQARSPIRATTPRKAKTPIRATTSNLTPTRRATLRLTLKRALPSQTSDSASKRSKPMP